MGKSRGQRLHLYRTARGNGNELGADEVAAELPVEIFTLECVLVEPEKVSGEGVRFAC